MSSFIYSTLSSNIYYPTYRVRANPNQATPNKVKSGVLLYGGANVANKNFVTPEGVVTEVSDEQLEELMNNEAFNRHLKRGFFSIQKKEVKIEKAVKDLKKKDKIAPITPEDLKGKYKVRKNSSKGDITLEAIDVID